MSWKQWLNTQYGNMSDSVKRFKNKDFMDAVVAGCAIVAAADGKIGPEEKQKMAGYIGRSEELKVFDMNEVVARFNKYAENFEFDFGIGKAEAWKAVSKFKGNADAGRVLISVCCAIGAADGDFDEKEKEVVREMCNLIGVAPKDFQL